MVVVCVYVACTLSFSPFFLILKRKVQGPKLGQPYAIPPTLRMVRGPAHHPGGNEVPSRHSCVVAGKMNWATCGLCATAVLRRQCRLRGERASSQAMGLRNRREYLVASLISHTSCDVKSLNLTNPLSFCKTSLKYGCVTYNWKKLAFYNKRWPFHVPQQLAGSNREAPDITLMPGKNTAREKLPG